ncbi:MAG: hypothetical protein ACRDVW_06850, partial [Acidimicrobiales bacterium]
CSLVADKVVDTATAPLYASTSDATVQTAIASMAHGLMGLDSSRDTQPIAILSGHYSDAVAGGAKPTVALKSTFTLACLSPWVVSIGQ